MDSGVVAMAELLIPLKSRFKSRRAATKGAHAGPDCRSTRNMYSLWSGRYYILQVPPSSPTVNIYDEISKARVTIMIAKLKISVERKYIHPFFKYIDQDNSGIIDYPEFEKYI